jgi:hypothetical protein
MRTPGLLRVFGAENEHPFGVWTYSTPEPLEAVLRKGHFRGWHGRLQLGDLVICGASQGPGPWNDQKRDVRRALLMVSSKASDGLEVRLLQDWGTPEGPALPAPSERPPARPARRSLPALQPEPGHRPRRRPRRMGDVAWRG